MKAFTISKDYPNIFERVFDYTFHLSNLLLNEGVEGIIKSLKTISNR